MIFAYNKSVNRVVHVNCPVSAMTYGSIRECRDRCDRRNKDGAAVLWCPYFRCDNCNECAPKNNSLQVAHNWEEHLWGPPQNYADHYVIPWNE
jgi:hypothetical protein